MKSLNLFISFILMSALSSSALAQSSAASALEIRVIAASWCGWCVMLEKDLRAKDVKNIPVTVDGQTVTVPLKVIRNDSGSMLKPKGGFPQVQIYRDGQLVSYGGIFVAKANVMTAEDLGRSVNAIVAKHAARMAKLASMPQAKAYVTFMTSGYAENEVPVQVGNSLEDIKNLIVGTLNFNPSFSLTLFGSGQESSEPDGYRRDQKTGSIQWLNWPDLKAEGSVDTFHQGTVSWAIDKAASLGISKRLWILTGHGSVNSVNTWASEPLTMSWLRTNLRRGGTSMNVMMSSTCHGGSFAPAVTCGFFAARPDTLAHACRETDEKSSDYLTSFFEAAANPAKADFDHDGKVTFAEAHWRASQDNALDVPYTNLDRAADEFFGRRLKAGANELPTSLNINAFEALVKSDANAGEALVARSLALSLAPTLKTTTSFSIKADAYRDQTTQWRMMRLASLARRLMLKKYARENPDTAAAKITTEITNCESQSLKDFLFN